MKRFCVVVSLIAICYGQRQTFRSQMGGLLRYQGDARTSQIDRPCPDMDLNCIRHFFAQNSQCSPAYGLVADPYPSKRVEMPVPHSNITFAWVGAEVEGLSRGEITEFYVNRAVNKLVLEVEFPAIRVVSSNCIIFYHLKGKEPTASVDHCEVTYRLVSLTMTVPFNNEIDMSAPQVYSYIGDSNAPIKTGRSFIRSEPELREAYEDALYDVSTSTRETFVVQGPMYMSLFLDRSVCSFKNAVAPLLLESQHQTALRH